MSFISKNPYTRKLLKKVPAWSQQTSAKAIHELYNEYLENREIGPEERKEKVKRELESLADSLTKHKKDLAEMLTTEMGKLITNSEGEIQKTILHCRWYANKADELLATKNIKTDPGARTGYFLDPIGVAYKIVPFNFPIWIGMKMIAPTMLTGNTVLLRSAGSTPQTFEILQRVFEDADFRAAKVGFVSDKDTEYLMSMPEVVGVSFTGSTPAGSRVAEAAAKHLKRTVLELGGNDPFIVFDDADIDLAVTLATRSRMANAGQVCFSSKRFIIERTVIDKFAIKLAEKLNEFKVGDPMDRNTKLGPLARDDLTVTYLNQLARAIKGGDKVLYGNIQPEGNLVSASIFRVDDPYKSVLTTEEVFGPCFALMPFRTPEEAIEIANSSQYGLGATIVSKNTKFAEGFARLIDSGLVYINNAVGSESALPCGGVKQSGYGRDLAHYGVESFANIKTFSLRP